MSEYRRRNLGDLRASVSRYPRHERHGSAPISLPLRGPASGLMSGSASIVTTRPHHHETPSCTKPIQLPSKLPTAMDFSQFRDSGELSDIVVSVDGRDFNLHKFPLYTRSDFFRALARSDSGKVVLDEFPGGAETFEMVANYCYNKRIDVNKENICKLRCAAEFLQMCTPGNLSDCADRYLLDMLTTAKLSRDTGVIVDLVLKCRPLGAIAEQANIIDRCLNGVVDCWLLSSKWTRRLPSDRTVMESSNFKRLCKLPLNWFKLLFKAAKDKNVRATVLAKLVQMYIGDKIQKKEQKERKEEEPKDQSEEEPEGAAAEPEQQSPDEDKDKRNESDDSKNNEDVDNKAETVEDAAKAASDDSRDDKSPSKPDKPDKSDTANDDAEDNDDDANDDVDLKVVMDTLLLELPEDTPLAETLSPQWAASMLRVADELQCRCRGLLLRISAKLLYRFTTGDLAEMPPPLLQEVIQAASKDPVQVDPDTVCSVVDGYLLDLAERDKLDVATFTNMSGSVPQDHRLSHDTLFKVLENLLKSDKIQITDEEKEAMMESVDFRRLSEAALQHAYDSKLVPDPFVTRAALALCARLRGELETARDIIRSQEEELDRFGLSGGRASSWLQGVETDFGLVTSSVEPEVRHSDYHLEDAPMSRLREEMDDEYYRYSPPGHDPILEKALGGRYFDDPFDLDSNYPWYRYTKSTGRSYYDDMDYGRDSAADHRRYLEPSSVRSSRYYRSSKW